MLNPLKINLKSVQSGQVDQTKNILIPYHVFVCNANFLAVHVPAITRTYCLYVAFMHHIVVVLS